MHQIIKIVKKTVPALTALTSPKLGTSLRWGDCLAQNVGSRLGETCNSGPWENSRALAQARPSRLSETRRRSKRDWPPGRALEAESWASFCYSRLGEASSLGREYQFSPTVPRMQPKTNKPNIFLLISHKHKHFPTHFMQQ